MKRSPSAWRKLAYAIVVPPLVSAPVCILLYVLGVSVDAIKDVWYAGMFAGSIWLANRDGTSLSQIGLQEAMRNEPSPSGNLGDGDFLPCWRTHFLLGCRSLAELDGTRLEDGLSGVSLHACGVGRGDMVQGSDHEETIGLWGGQRCHSRI